MDLVAIAVSDTQAVAIKPDITTSRYQISLFLKKKVQGLRKSAFRKMGAISCSDTFLQYTQESQLRYVFLITAGCDSGGCACVCVHHTSMCVYASYGCVCVHAWGQTNTCAMRKHMDVCEPANTPTDIAGTRGQCSEEVRERHPVANSN